MLEYQIHCSHAIGLAIVRNMKSWNSLHVVALVECTKSETNWMEWNMQSKKSAYSKNILADTMLC
jgi:hypothetical protein